MAETLGWEWNPAQCCWQLWQRGGGEDRSRGFMAPEVVVAASDAGYEGGLRAAELGILDAWQSFRLHVKDRCGVAFPDDLRPSAPQRASAAP
jgi:hypothetical protein